MKIIKTKSGEMLNDIGVISEGYLVYCDLKLTTLKKNEGQKDRRYNQIEFLVDLCNYERTQSK